MAFILKDASSVEHTYSKTKIKIPSTISGTYETFVSGGLQFEQVNTTYQSDDSKQALFTAAQCTTQIGATQFAAPCWMVGVAFVINSQVVLAILSVYVDENNNTAHFRGGINTGSAVVDMELTGTTSATNELSYTLDTLKVNDTDISASVSSTTPMRILLLKSM